MWTKNKSVIVWGLGIFTIILFLSNQSNFAKVKPIPTLEIVTTDADKRENIVLAFAGDMMLDRGVENSVYKNFSGDYGALFQKVQEKLQSYDVLFANLEGPISDKGNDIGGLYSFRFEPKVMPALKKVGFDVLSLANNHTYNWAEPALLDTIDLLSVTDIKYIGAGLNGTEAYQEKILYIDGVKIAFLSFNEFSAGGITSSSTSPGIAMISEEEIIKSVTRAVNNSDLVVVSYHFGEEYMDASNEYQRKYARLAIDSGADLIIGHHPHVIQALEKYKDRYVIYSLGNFIFDQYFSEETMQGGLLEVEVSPVSKKIEKVNLRKVFLNKYFQIENIE
jgi:hypothetical protein